MRSERLTYEADGRMVGRLYWDEARTGARPGVLVFPEGRGVTDLTCRFAERLAEQGYAALASDFFGDGHTAPPGGPVDAHTMGMLQALAGSTAKTRARGRGAFEALRARPEVDPARIAAIGYCFGGGLALELAFAGTPLAAAAGFHCGLHMLSLADSKKLTAEILICLGADDPYASPEDRSKLEAAMKGLGKRWQLNLYGSVVHSFTNPTVNTDITRYDAYADRDSWDALMALLTRAFAK